MRPGLSGPLMLDLLIFIFVSAAALVEKQAEQLVIMHKEGCPWRTRQCDR